MKKYTIIITALLGVSLALSQQASDRAPGTNAPSVGVGGITSVQNNIATFGPYNGVNLYYVAGGIYVDSVPSSTTYQPKRIDNNADSCSNPFWLSRDSLGKSGHIWQVLLEPLVKSTDADSSATAFRVQTRTFDWIGPPYNRFRARPWTRVGKNQGDAQFTVSDTVALPTIGQANVKWAQYGTVSVLGTQARLCPKRIAGTASAATDTIWHDSIKVTVR